MIYPKGKVPPKLAERLVDAHDRMEAARAERDRLIVKALDDGGSLTAVSELIGLSTSGIRKIARRAGWTAEGFKARVDADRNWAKDWLEDQRDKP